MLLEILPPCRHTSHRSEISNIFLLDLLVGLGGGVNADAGGAAKEDAVGGDQSIGDHEDPRDNEEGNAGVVLAVSVLEGVGGAAELGIVDTGANGEGDEGRDEAGDGEAEGGKLQNLLESGEEELKGDGDERGGDDEAGDDAKGVAGVETRDGLIADASVLPLDGGAANAGTIDEILRLKGALAERVPRNAGADAHKDERDEQNDGAGNEEDVKLHDD